MWRERGSNERFFHLELQNCCGHGGAEAHTHRGQEQCRERCYLGTPAPPPRHMFSSCENLSAAAGQSLSVKNGMRRRRRRRGERERERSERRSAQEAEAEAEREGESGHAAICRKNYRPGLIKLFDRLEADTEDRARGGEREACLPAAWYYSSAAAAIA